MQGVPEHFEHPADKAQYKRPAHRAGVELYRAHIVRHAFDPHTHGAFGIGAIESGVERFRYRGAEHLAPPDSLVLMNPDVLHTGHAETEGGWRYRMAYLDADVVEAVTGESGWWFADAVRHAPVSARRVTALLDAMWQADEPLAFDSALLDLVTEIRRHARIATPSREGNALRFANVIEYLHAHFDARVSLEELARIADLSPFHFLRSFRAQHDATPAQMLMAIRLFEAKRLLAAGVAPAQVAAATGLTDQAHLTRAFARRYGVTPGEYRRQLRGH